MFAFEVVKCLPVGRQRNKSKKNLNTIVILKELQYKPHWHLGIIIILYGLDSCDSHSGKPGILSMKAVQVSTVFAQRKVQLFWLYS